MISTQSNQLLVFLFHVCNLNQTAATKKTQKIFQQNCKSKSLICSINFRVAFVAFGRGASSQASTERRPPNSNPLPEASEFWGATSCLSLFAVGSNAGFVEKCRISHLLSQQEMWYFSQHWRELLIEGERKEKIQNTKIKESPPSITRLLYPFNLTTSWRTKNLSQKISVHICNFSHHENHMKSSNSTVHHRYQMRQILVALLYRAT